MSDRPPSEWESCQPGDIAQVACGLRQRASRRRFLKVGAASAVAVGGGAWLFWPQRADRPGFYAGIACGDVVRSEADFLAGRLTETLQSQFREHIARCPACRQHFRPFIDING